jgi:hypothetical protein
MVIDADDISMAIRTNIERLAKFVGVDLSKPAYRNKETLARAVARRLNRIKCQGK